MMSRRSSLFLLLIVLIACGAAVWFFWERIITEKSALLSSPGPSLSVIVVSAPLSGESVVSPLIFEGQARGGWFFEASFPVKLLDDQGQELGWGIAQAQSDWMTSKMVPFKGEIVFSQPEGETGQLVFLKDNPSGLPANDAQFAVPVSFR